MSAENHKNNFDLKSGKKLSIFTAILLMLPLVISVYREWGFYASQNENVSVANFLKDRYSGGGMIVIDMICLVSAILIIWFILKIQKRIKTSEMFLKMTTAANVPVFLIDGERSLHWSNVGDIDIFGYYAPAEVIELITEGEDAQAQIAACMEKKEQRIYEKEIALGDTKYWLHVTLSNVTGNNGKSLICVTVSDISNMKEANERIANQQRELQMQTEMMALITAQMEVQQAGIKEQNSLLQDQRNQLEIQAVTLKEAFSELEERNHQIITKTNYITDSIKYAQTIQEAMLPDESQLNEFFDNFIIYRPKDIVSGDFYWMSRNGNSVFAVLGDCTGHGVPGAFMSMIGIRLLSELINEQKIRRPSVIMEAMHCKIQAALKQDVSENNDGMDIAICRFDRVENGDCDWRLEYCGAKQPIYIVRKGECEEAEQLDCDRRGVGGQTIAEIFFFEDRELNLNNGDRIYLTSDGIKDQNNITRKRFGSARMRKILAMTRTERIQDQKMFLDTMITNWQGLEEQRDDISLWGFELSDKII